MCMSKSIGILVANRIGRKRLHIDLPEGIYKELKLLAIQRNCTLTKVVLRALIDRLKLERNYTE